MSALENSPVGRHGMMHALLISYGYVGVQFVLTPLRIRVLTEVLSKSEYFLLNLVTMTIALLAMLASFGGLEYLIRRIPGAGSQERDALIGRSTLGYAKVLMVFAALSVPVVWAVQPLFRPEITLTIPDLLACALGLVCWGHLLQRHTVLLSLSHNGRYRLLQFLYGEAWLVPVLVVWWTGGIDHHRVLWAWAGWMAFIAVATAGFVPYRAAFRARGKVPSMARDMLIFGLPLVPLIAGEQLFRLGDRYLLGLYHGAEIGAEYTVCMSIALIAYTVGNNVLMIMVPVFNRTKAERGRAGAADDHSDPALRVLFSRMLRYAWIFAFVTVSAFLFCPDAFVRLLAAPKYADAAYLLRWASPTAFFFISFAVFSRVLIAEDRHWLVGGLTLAGAGLNILLNVVLIPTLAGVGAALATSISLAAMCLAAGVVLKAWTWIEPGELHLVKLGALLIVSALLFAGLHRTGWVALIQVALGGTGCLALMFGLRLFRPGELAGLTGGRATP